MFCSPKAHRGDARLRLLLACCAALLLAPLPSDTQTFRSAEKPVKAAFVCQFPSFLDWERQEAPAEGAAVRLGILGDDPFEGELEKAVRAQVAKGRRFEVLHARDPAALLDCHVVCIGLDLGAAFDAALEHFHKAGIATICDRPGAARRGVLINFVLVQDRVAFEINVDTSKQAGIKISAQLLKLAILVRSESDEQDTGDAAP